MLNKLPLIASFLLLRLFANGQEEFSVQLFLKDAVGNLDTVIVGYDTNGTDSIEQSFGEIELLNQPWGSGLDARASIHDYAIQTPYSQSKKQIILKTCSINNAVCIDIHTANYPVTIKWNSFIFNDTNCNSASVISTLSSFSIDVNPDYWEFMGTQYGNSDSIVFSSPEVNYTYYDGQENIPVIWVRFSRPEEVFLGMDELSSNKIALHPNPVHENGLLKLNFSGSYQLITYDGKIVESKICKDEINLDGIMPGTYFLLLNENNDQARSIKIVIV